MTRIKVFLDQESRTVKFAKIYLVNVSEKTYGFHNGRRDFNQEKLLEYLYSEHHTGSQISPNKLFTSIILTVRKDGRISEIDQKIDLSYFFVLLHTNSLECPVEWFCWVIFLMTTINETFTKASCEWSIDVFITYVPTRSKQLFLEKKKRVEASIVKYLSNLRNPFRLNVTKKNAIFLT